MKQAPLRRCIACRQRKEKHALIRIVRREEGLVVDSSGKMDGRGAYVCRDPKCVAMAQRRNLLKTAFKMSVPETIYEELFSDVTETR